MYKPEPKTVRRTLSAIINLAKFREEKVVAYEELREASETTLERKAALQTDHDKLVRIRI
jgi:kinetochore protein Nuf2